MKFRVPLGLEFGADPPQVRWRPADGSRFTEPFFDDTLSRLRRSAGRRLPTWTTPADLWTRNTPIPRPTAFILHVSRCGSTLLSRMLAAVPTNFVVSEARIFDDILRAKAHAVGVAEEARDAWLAGAVHSFVCSQAMPPERLIIKLDCWHIFELERLRRVFPGVPLLFVHRNPLEVLVSLLQRPSFTLVRGTVTPEEIGIGTEQRDAMSREELAAAIMGAFFRRASQNREHLVSVPYTSLPAFACSGIPGVQFSRSEVEALRQAAEFDAKQPRTAFVPDSERKRAAATDAVRAACARWAEPAYQAWLAAP